MPAIDVDVREDLDANLVSQSFDTYQNQFDRSFDAAAVSPHAIQSPSKELVAITGGDFQVNSISNSASPMPKKPTLKE